VTARESFMLAMEAFVSMVYCLGQEVMRVMYNASPQHHSYTTSGPADRTQPQMRSQMRSDDPSCAILPSLGAMYS
jgi:hypothetical protein